MSRYAPMLVVIVVLGAMPAPLPTEIQTRKTEPARISVRLSTPRKNFSVGEPIPLRVEIENRGQASIFVGREIELITGWINFLELEVVDLRGNKSPSVTLAPPLVPPPDPNQSFADALARWWIALPPGYSYGTILSIDGEMYRFLQKPGTYQIRGTYYSQGMLAPVYYNPLRFQPEEVAKLSFSSWTGDTETNSLTVEIVARRDSSEKRK